MKIRAYVPLLVFFLFLLSCSCGKGDDNRPEFTFFFDKYGGAPFQGTASGVLTGTDGQTLQRWEGKGIAAVMEPKGDSVSVVFRADFDDEGEINFKIGGVQRGLDFRMQEGLATFDIIDSDITGHIKNGIQDMNFSGRLTETRAQLTMEVMFVESMNNFPKGSVMTIVFDSVRSIDENSGGEGCTLRLVPVWGPSGMTMGMVPDC